MFLVSILNLVSFLNSSSIQNPIQRAMERAMGLGLDLHVRTCLDLELNPISFRSYYMFEFILLGYGCVIKNA